MTTLEHLLLVLGIITFVCVILGFTLAIKRNSSNILDLENVIYGPCTIKFKRVHPRAQKPERFHSADQHGNLGTDITCVSVTTEIRNGITYLIYNTGLAFEAPYPLGLLAFPRSSLWKSNLMLSNSVGVIDRNYRGEVLAVFKVDDNFTANQAKEFGYKEGDRIIQMVATIIPQVKYEENYMLTSTARGGGGFGSTGK